MANLKQETINALTNLGKAAADVVWCGSPEWGWFTWDEFCELADSKYDDDFGSQEVASDLLIVGQDWWLEREEYDGSEGWAFKSLPIQPTNHAIPAKIMPGMWDTLKGMNDTE